MRIQKHVFLAFKVEGQKLERGNTNPVLHKFYHMLNDFKIEKSGAKVVVTSKDPAVLQVIDSTWIKGSIHLDTEIIGYREAEKYIADIDHEMGAFILNGLKNLEVDEGKYSHIKISVLEATFSQTLKEHPEVWPVEPAFRTRA